MEDPTTIALNLTFFGTLGVAFVMFIGLILVFMATLVMAGLGRLVGVLVMALFGRRPAAAPDIRTHRPLKMDAAGKGALSANGRAKTERPPQAGPPRREPHILAEDWATAVAEADARADARAKAEAAPEVKVTVRDLPSPGAPADEVRSVAPLVESATDQHALVKAIPRAFEKPPGPGRNAMLDTGSLVSLAGHPAALKSTLPAERRRAG
jgi:hypothetical protein